MRVLNVEDNAIKHTQILRTLRELYIEDKDIIWARNMEEAFDILNEDTDFGLIISDMNYPLKPGDPSDGDAGEIFINKMTEQGSTTPIILCSHQNYKVPDAYACIYCNEDKDWQGDLSKAVKALL